MPLNPAFQKELKRRGLTLKEARAFGLGARKIGVRIPYFNADGSPVLDHGREYFKLRLYSPRPGKPKYLAPRGSLSHLYLVPTVDYGEADYYLWTEGEFKCMLAATYGYAAVGLQGVWNFAMKSGFPPEAGALDYAKQHYIIFDSDKYSNPDVKKAERRLANELTKRGGEVLIVNLPEGGPKGLDDFLLERGEAEFGKLLDKAKEWITSPEDEIVELFNARFFWTLSSRTGNAGEMEIWEILPDGELQRWGERAFSRQFASYGGRERKGKGKGTVKNTEVWLASPDSRQLSFVWDPHLPPGEVGGLYNTCKGRPQGRAGKEDSAHLDRMRSIIRTVWAAQMGYEDDEEMTEEVFTYLECWMADMVQNRDIGHTAIMLISMRTGTGKSLFGDFCETLIGSHNTRRVIGSLKGISTGGFGESLLFRVEEAKLHNISGDLSNLLKSLITDPMVEERKLYSDPRTVRNYNRVIITGNNAEAVRIENDDRRYCVLEPTGAVSANTIGSRQADEVKRFILGDGARVYRDYLETVDIADWNRFAIPDTPMRRNLMARSLSSLLDLWREMVYRGFNGLARGSKNNFIDVWLRKCEPVEGTTAMIQFANEVGVRFTDRFPPPSSAKFVSIVQNTHCGKLARNQVGKEYLYFHSLERCRKALRVAEKRFINEVDELEDQYSETEYGPENNVIHLVRK